MFSRKRLPQARVLRVLLATAALAQITHAATGGGVGDYNVVWRSPSRNASGSMPLGNGDIALNTWMEENGDLLFYIGKTDSWGDNARLLKVGKVRISLDPSPLSGNSTFTQTLDLKKAEVRIDIESQKPDARTTMRVWVDANHPVVHVESQSNEATTARAKIELWRTERNELPSLEVSDVHLDRSEPGQKHAPTIVEPDTIMKGPKDRIGWYHHNAKSVGPELTMRIQGLADYPLDDPLLHRTFGAVVRAVNGRRIDDVMLESPAGKSHRFDVYVLTRHPAKPDAWIGAMNQTIESIERTPFEQRRRDHERWWEEFWDRSWIRIHSSKTSQPSLIDANDHPVRIGADQTGGNRFRGTIARFSMFDRVLGAKDVATLASDRRQPLDEREGLRMSLADVKPGFTLPDSRNLLASGAFTLEAWIRPGAPVPGGGRIVDKVTAGRNDGFLLDTYPGNSLRLIAKDDVRTFKDCLTADRWHHVAVSGDPGRGTLVLYLDGKELARQTTEPGDDAYVVSRGYQLQRFINACAGRGQYPIKFNGSIFTVPFADRPGDADYRRWGSGYWWQNTRLPYIGMCTSGDFDLMAPLFRMYAGEVLDVSTFRTKRYFEHGGAYFPECIYFWGAVFSESYGWTPFEERKDKLQTSGWHKWEWVSGPELVWMMLDCYEHTLDEAFLRERLLPAAHEVLTFFDQHYETSDSGKLVMHPSQALETWWDCTNPMPEVAGLRAVTERLLALPERLSSTEQRAFWRTVHAKIPELPTRETDGVRMLAPAERFENKRNIENPELYAVFPFRLVAVGRPDIELARAALEHRWDRGSSGWRQDDVFMAYLGIADQARANVVKRARSSDGNSRFPAFWGPNYDWVPDQDHGGILIKAVQAMLMQTNGRKIYLLPAWPSDWEAEFKLHAPYRTVVEGSVNDGKVTNLIVTPESRHADVVFLNDR